MRTITKAELAEILDKHKKWLNGEEGGERADLHEANLSYANLSDANLSRADLRGADLYYANLGGAILCDANLSGAILSGADLSRADLSRADLRCADLNEANLYGADLNEANLYGADLSRANLRGANLRGADLREADIDYCGFPLWCGSLHAHFDDRQIIQLIYHAVKAGVGSPNVSDELKEVLYGLADTANKFHRADACGRIERIQK